MNQQIIDDLTKRMSDLYLMFCMPRITLNTETGKVDISYIWTSEEARQAFESMQEELSRQFVELRKRQAVEHSVHPTGGRLSAWR